MKKSFLMFMILMLTSCTGAENMKYSDQIVIREAAVADEVPDNIAEGSELPTEPPVELTKNTADVVNEYILNLDVDPVNRTVKGVQRVKFTNTSENTLKNIYFNLYLNAFDMNVIVKPYFQSYEEKIFSQGRDYGYIDIIKMTINQEDADYAVDGTVMKVTLDETLVPHEQIEITLYFEAYIPLISHRTGANEHASWYGNFLPILAVYDERGWRVDRYYQAGDPFFSDISNYTVTIVTPHDYTVIGTGAEKTSLSNDKKITVITANMVRDFTFAISNKYDVATITTNNGVDVNFYYYSKIPELYNYLAGAKNALEYFDDLIGAYPYSSVDIIECELFFQSGMEYSQVIFMDSTYLKSASSYKTIVHEIAHQWFYNIIGSDQINEAWLDESLASFVQDMYVYGNEFDTHMNSEYNTLSSNISRLENPRLTGNLSIYNRWSDYYNVHYVKGKLMVYYLSKLMGDDMFKEFLRTYYNRYCFKTANKNDFISVAEEIYGKSLSDFFSSWINDKELPSQ